MPTTDENPPVTARKTCPLCDAPLDESNPNACPKCDWYAGYRQQREEPFGTGRDVAAALMSVVPGLGHIYKGYTMTGVLYMLGGVFAVFAAGVAATATAGFGLLLLPLYWIGIMLQVFWLEDRRAVPRKT
jgi:hypothetical protein